MSGSFSDLGPDSKERIILWYLCKKTARELLEEINDQVFYGKGKIYDNLGLAGTYYFNKPPLVEPNIALDTESGTIFICTSTEGCLRVIAETARYPYEARWWSGELELTKWMLRQAVSSLIH